MQCRRPGFWCIPYFRLIRMLFHLPEPHSCLWDLESNCTLKHAFWHCSGGILQHKSQHLVQKRGPATWTFPEKDLQGNAGSPITSTLPNCNTYKRKLLCEMCTDGFRDSFLSVWFVLGRDWNECYQFSKCTMKSGNWVLDHSFGLLRNFQFNRL